jgi:hypothetical protein
MRMNRHGRASKWERILLMPERHIILSAKGSLLWR